MNSKRLEDWKSVIWPDNSQFLLAGPEFDINMNSICLTSMIYTAGSGIIVWEIFSWHTLRFLVPI